MDFETVRSSDTRLYTPKRFYIMFLFSLCQIVNCTAWMNFAGLIDKMLVAYGPDGCTTSWLNFFSFVFMILYVPMNFVSTWFIEKKGIRTALLLGVGIQAVGFWIRTFLNQSFAMLILGQTLLGVGQPFIYNLPTKISAVWFPKKERVASTMVAVNMSIVGCITGFFLPLVMVPTKVNNDPNDFQQEAVKSIRHEVFSMMLVMAVTESVVLLLLYFSCNEV